MSCTHVSESVEIPIGKAYIYGLGRKSVDESQQGTWHWSPAPPLWTCAPEELIKIIDCHNEFEYFSNN